MGKETTYFVRASLVALHLHLHLRFFIRDAYADAGSKPSGPCKLDFGMNFLAGTTVDPA